MRCSPFVETLLKTTELTRRQPIDILKVRVIAFIRTIQTVPINDVNSLLTTKQSPINILLGRYCIRITWYKESPTIS